MLPAMLGKAHSKSIPLIFFMSSALVRASDADTTGNSTCTENKVHTKQLARPFGDETFLLQKTVIVKTPLQDGTSTDSESGRSKVESYTSDSGIDLVGENSYAGFAPSQMKPMTVKDNVRKFQPTKLGMTIGDWNTGEISDVEPRTQASNAGVTAGMEIFKVGNFRFSQEHLMRAIKGEYPFDLTFNVKPRDDTPIEPLMAEDEEVTTEKTLADTVEEELEADISDKKNRKTAAKTGCLDGLPPTVTDGVHRCGESFRATLPNLDFSMLLERHDLDRTHVHVTTFRAYGLEHLGAMTSRVFLSGECGENDEPSSPAAELDINRILDCQAIKAQKEVDQAKSQEPAEKGKLSRASDAYIAKKKEAEVLHAKTKRQAGDEESTGIEKAKSEHPCSMFTMMSYSAQSFFEALWGFLTQKEKQEETPEMKNIGLCLKNREQKMENLRIKRKETVKSADLKRSQSLKAARAELAAAESEFGRFRESQDMAESMVAWIPDVKTLLSEDVQTGLAICRKALKGPDTIQPAKKTADESVKLLMLDNGLKSIQDPEAKEFYTKAKLKESVVPPLEGAFLTAFTILWKSVDLLVAGVMALMTAALGSIPFVGGVLAAFVPVVVTHIYGIIKKTISWVLKQIAGKIGEAVVSRTTYDVKNAIERNVQSVQRRVDTGNWMLWENSSTSLLSLDVTRMVEIGVTEAIDATVDAGFEADFEDLGKGPSKEEIMTKMGQRADAQSRRASWGADYSESGLDAVAERIIVSKKLYAPKV